MAFAFPIQKINFTQEEKYILISLVIEEKFLHFFFYGADISNFFVNSLNRNYITQGSNGIMFEFW